MACPAAGRYKRRQKGKVGKWIVRRATDKAAGRTLRKLFK